MPSWKNTTLVSLLAFVLLALVLHLAPNVVDAIDAAIGGALRPLQTLTGIQLFLVITVLGGGVGIMAVAVGFSYLARLSSAEALRLVTLLVLVTGANRLLKDLFARTRPDALPWIDPLASYSFPSAHASSAMALYGFIAVVLYVRTKGAWYAFLPILIIAGVGLSRIVLAAHHFSDVLGGYLLGLAGLGLVFLLPFRKLDKRRS